MGFLDKNYSAGPVASRLTQKGRESIANGNFVITHFAIGDSEYSYSGSTTGQTIMAPFDDYGNVKGLIDYDYESDSESVKKKPGKPGFILHKRVSYWLTSFLRDGFGSKRLRWCRYLSAFLHHS